MLLVSILSQLNPINTIAPHFFKMHFNVIFPSTASYVKWFLPFRFSDQNFVCISRLPVRSIFPVYLILDLITLIIRGEVYKLLSSSLCSFPIPLPLRSKYSPQHPVLRHPQSVLFPR